MKAEAQQSTQTKKLEEAQLRPVIGGITDMKMERVGVDIKNQIVQVSQKVKEEYGENKREEIEGKITEVKEAI